MPYVQKYYFLNSKNNKVPLQHGKLVCEKIWSLSLLEQIDSNVITAFSAEYVIKAQLKD